MRLQRRSAPPLARRESRAGRPLLYTFYCILQHEHDLRRRLRIYQYNTVSLRRFIAYDGNVTLQSHHGRQTPEIVQSLESDCGALKQLTKPALCSECPSYAILIKRAPPLHASHGPLLLHNSEGHLNAKGGGAHAHPSWYPHRYFPTHVHPGMRRTGIPMRFIMDGNYGSICTEQQSGLTYQFVTGQS